MRALIPFYCNFSAAFETGPILIKEVRMSIGKLVARAKTLEELEEMSRDCTDAGREILDQEGEGRIKELEELREMEKKKENAGIKLKKFGKK